ncbi:Cullin-1 [Tyrophagus putrescentiae]|nr:Cullin-1 [Tyrophagus putrescentiae]
MAVLLAYNTTDQFIVRQLYERTKIARNKLIQVLTSLLKAKLLVVVTEKVISDNCEKESRAKEVKSNWPVLNLNSVLSLNLSAIKGRRNVNISKHYSNSSSQKIVEKTIEADQKLAIQAAIVRILKGSRSLAHQQLFTEVTLQLMSRFTPKEATVQQCIRILIDKEYIRSTQKSSSSASASNPHTIFYQYLE